MKLSEAFRLVAERMQSVDPLDCHHGEKYICLTLDFHPEIPIKTSKKAKEVIRKRLGDNCFTYKLWIKKYHPDLMINCEYGKQQEQLHQGRIAWLWSLYEEFKKKQK